MRWRPLNPSEAETGEIQREYGQHHSNPQSCVSITSPLQAKALSTREKSWKSGFSFDGIIECNDNNHLVFNRVVAPIIPEVLEGKPCNFFAYGHSAAARQLSAALEDINSKNNNHQFGIGLRVFELRKNIAFDLLNERNECFVREGSDGRVYIRGETEMLENGKVRVRPIATKACWSFEELHQELQKGLKHRKTATSTVHDQSSRTHAVIELEIITKDLLNARDQVVERQSELVPVGKHATDIYIEEQSRAVVQTEEGKFIPNPDYQMDQVRVDAAEAKKAEFESRVKEAEEHESEVFAATARTHRCIGGKLVFVDLAGAEFLSSTTEPAFKQTPQEKQEGRQINTDLLALKEVIRSRSSKKSRIPYCSSPLTMVLREHFEASTDTHSAMILTVSPEASQYTATTNTLKYGDLVGLANGHKR
ncbi:unnamed protein product [Penicillium nalgiovense]|uniref:Kinesin-like protein n=1 Tax=Penicillium nalgiovense TaxID=60175 RepID=A0A1V6XNB9_PENNA|nr:hypothetical protein PENNAL_c0066G07523 [Penicillium nalgiovense]CAG7946691.1 unnamed protein product [Penicillium nalgiovense]CAG7967432.1 unnamed protein product [Penicillium nalgiovense]CAG7982405.1 unnamed protein product [Penicillium nalgiovense]CAG7997769.1 unnamed protein product [Penicillium nalgiovense]